jgi:hypothetical protein
MQWREEKLHGKTGSNPVPMSPSPCPKKKGIISGKKRVVNLSLVPRMRKRIKGLRILFNGFEKGGWIL